MIRIVIADDHVMFRQGLVLLLRSAEGLTLVGEAADGREALRLIAEARPDIAVLDVSMPELTGIEVLREVKKEKLPTRIVLLTMHTDPELASEALEAGASGYLLKGNAFEDLLQAMQCVARGGSFVSALITAELLRSRRPQDEDREPLTPREREILKYIAAGMTARQIGDTLHISTKTVETHRARIMNKLGLHTSAALVHYAIRKGIAKLTNTSFT
jgi:DNA-binding NarL/FixJ family response regulator